MISTDARNDRAGDLIVIPCSTNLREAPTHVRLRSGEGGLSHACVLKCEQITTLSRYDVERMPIGSGLTTARIAEVERAVFRAIGLPI